MLSVLNISDVRYHQYYHQFPNGHYNHSYDFEQFPYGLPIILPFEKWFAKHFPFMIDASNKYWHYSLYISALYLITIQLLIRLMSNRTNGFNLRRELIIWNWIMAIFSFIATVRCLPEFIFVLKNDGFFHSYAKNTYGKVMNDNHHHHY